MRATIKQTLRFIVLPIFMMVMILGVFSQRVDAKVTDIKDEVILDNSVLKATVVSTGLKVDTSRADYTGYYFDVKFTNKTDKPILVQMYSSKINNSAFYDSVMLNNQYITSNYASSYVRVNAGQSVTRTGLISNGTLGSHEVTKIHNIQGRFEVKDFQGNTLSNNSQSWKYSLKLDDEQEGSNLTDDVPYQIKLGKADGLSGDLKINFKYSTSITGTMNYLYYDIQNSADDNLYLEIKSAGESYDYLMTTTLDSKGVYRNRNNSVSSYSDESSIYDSLVNGTKIDLVCKVSKMNEQGFITTLVTKNLSNVDLSVIPQMDSSYSISGSINGPEIVYLGEAERYYRLYNNGVYLDNNGVIWESSEKDIATIDKNGRLTMINPGRTIISARYNDRLSTCVVEVKEPELTLSTKNIYAGLKSYFSYSINPDPMEDDRDIVLESDNEDVLKIDGNYFIGLKEGTATVKATYTTGAGYKCEAEQVVRVKKLNSFSLSSSKVTMNYAEHYRTSDDDDEDYYWYGGAGISINIPYYYNTYSLYKDAVKWAIADDSVASMSVSENGNNVYLIAKKVGTTTLTATIGDITKTCEIIVKEPSGSDEEENTAEEMEQGAQKAPVINTTGFLHESLDNSGVSVKLERGEIKNQKYNLVLNLDNKTSEYKYVSINISSINGLKFNNNNSASYYNYGASNYISLSAKEHQQFTIVIEPRVFAQLGTMEISQIKGSVEYDGEKHPFTIGTNGTVYERTDKNGKLVVNNADKVSIEVVSIVEYTESDSATVNFYVRNESDEAITPIMYLEKINDIEIPDNVNFSSEYLGNIISIQPHERMYGSFDVPARSYKLSHRDVKSLDIDVTIKYSGEKAMYDETHHVDTTGIAIKSEELYISVPTLYAGEPYCMPGVYEGTSGYGIYTELYDGDDLQWTSSDTSILNITSDGKFYPLSEGEVLVTVTDGKRKGSTIVAVRGPEIIITNNYNLYAGGISSFAYTIHPYNKVDYSKVEIEVSDEDLFEIVEKRAYSTSLGAAAYIHAKGAGEAQIKVKYKTEDDIEIEGTATLNASATNKIKLSTNHMNMYMDDYGSRLYASAGYEGYCYLYAPEWSVDDESVVKLITPDTRTERGGYYFTTAYPGNGEVLIRPVGVGSATITCTYNGMKETCTIVVSDRNSSYDDDDDYYEDDDEETTVTDNNKNIQGNDENSATPNPATVPAANPSADTGAGETVANAGEVIVDKYTGASYTIKPDGGVEFTAISNTKATKVTIPDVVTINGVTYPVTSVSANAFKNNKKITTIAVGKNVKSIEASAFQGASNLKTVNLTAAKVEVIKKNAFKNCKQLTTLKINGNSLKKVEKGAFSGVNKKARVVVAAKDKKTFDKDVRKLTKAGLKNANFKFAKKKK